MTRVSVRGEWVELTDGGQGACKVCRLSPSGQLAFLDRCRRRESERGTDQVVVPLVDFVAALVESLDDPSRVVASLLNTLQQGRTEQ